ncbi:uncharacterized protein LOC131079903 [Cryptomeria japonica]|uniref:uncharacterized protein LOC131079903 n=1 Tax=Cryptomeria japonica TaxID=3369 RepID=UPI0027DA36D2|nr:uncharacterized protein LOC131079903 [Cryptomeria japonica]
MASLDSIMDENERRFLSRATALRRPVTDRQNLPTSSENSGPSNTKKRNAKPNNNKIMAPSSSKRKRGEEKDDSAGNEEERKKSKDEGEREESNVVVEIEMVKNHVKNLIGDYVRTMLSEENELFTKENEIMIDRFINELSKENQKHQDCIMKMANYTKLASFNMPAISNSYYISTEMLEEPLTNLEMEKLKQKWRQQKALELEATIKRFALMQEEIQMKMARIRTVLNDNSF